MMNLSEVVNGLVGEGKCMEDEMQVSPKVKEKAMKLLDQVKEMLIDDGVDPMKFMHEAMEMEAPKEKKPAKALIIASLKKKNGMSEDE